MIPVKISMLLAALTFISPVAMAAPEARTFDGIEFVWIPAGTFTMGTTKDHYSSRNREHQVTLTKGFWLGKYELTQAQWQKVMGDNPAHFRDPRRPVESIKISQVKEYIHRLNGKGKGPYRLPTEAEWEYAARAGSPQVAPEDRCPSTREVNFYDEHPAEGCPLYKWRNWTMPVGSFPANTWGLYDMLGNVTEYVQDGLWNYPTEAQVDPGPDDGTGAWDHVVRGGGYRSWHGEITPTYRDKVPDDRQWDYVGFRLVREAP
ncbi:formylglycine-generating enzyme family protein [Mariprofundus erugo]|uniref:formylglycine-generating enzyme family protein n=1 Tax=Mariprofundus erugo TaxID=2528639 RepID=UPI001EE88B56|nr:formylglycine-generating enzyme family protein [Mariprofundus erugo]